jgi:hypothetical protein
MHGAPWTSKWREMLYKLTLRVIDKSIIIPIYQLVLTPLVDLVSWEECCLLTKRRSVAENQAGLTLV